MMNYVFGGYVETAGNYEGKDWKSLVLLLGLQFDDEPPVTAKAYKAKAFLAPAVKQIEIGSNVNIRFNEQGKISDINVI